MRKALAVSLLAVLLGGCASDPAKHDVGGIWINQVAIDAASKGGPLREALQANGPTLEWEINTKAGQARYTNGFETVEGKLPSESADSAKIEVYGSAPPNSSAAASDCSRSPTTMSPSKYSTVPRSQPRRRSTGCQFRARPVFGLPGR